MGIHVTRLCLLVLFFGLHVKAAQGEDWFAIQPVAEGVYAAIPTSAAGGTHNSNAAIIILDDGVLVVDTHGSPSAARALTAQIKNLTDKPVKYVVNSHHHFDHIYGNEAYLKSWPAGIDIISTQATRRALQRFGEARLRNPIASLSREIDQLQRQLAASPDSRKQDLLKERDRRRVLLAEFEGVQLTLPTMTFERGLTIHRPSMTVEILWLGHGHTDGDLWVYLPKQRVLVTGDSLTAGYPYMSDSYPYEWIDTLDAAEKLDFDYVISGHGEVMKGKQKFEVWKSYFRDLLEQTSAAYAEGETEEKIKVRVSNVLLEKYARQFPPGLEARLSGHVQRGYEVVVF